MKRYRLSCLIEFYAQRVLGINNRIKALDADFNGTMCGKTRINFSAFKRTAQKLSADLEVCWARYARMYSEIWGLNPDNTKTHELYSEALCKINFFLN